MFLQNFIGEFKGQVFPEFPTGNGKIDIIIKYAERMYGIEVKSFTNLPGYKEALKKAAEYGKRLGLSEIHLVFFVERIDDENRRKYEKDYADEASGVDVRPIFVETEK